jgi:hypothetical protein
MFPKPSLTGARCPASGRSSLRQLVSRRVVGSDRRSVAFGGAESPIARVLQFVALVALACSCSANPATVNAEEGRGAAASYVVAAYVDHDCRSASAWRAATEPTDRSVQCLALATQAPWSVVRRSGRFYRICPDASIGQRAGHEQPCFVFQLVSRAPNASMTTPSRPAFSYTLGSLYVYVMQNSGRWNVEETAYAGGACAGTTRDCAPEQAAWSRRVVVLPRHDGRVLFAD